MEAELRKLRIDRGPTAIILGSKGRAGHICGGVICSRQYGVWARTPSKKNAAYRARVLPAQATVENLKVKLDARRADLAHKKIAKAKPIPVSAKANLTMSSRQAGRAGWSAMECWLAKQ